MKDVKVEVIEMGELNWCEYCVVEFDCLFVDIVEVLLDFYCVGINVYVDYDWFDVLIIEDVVVCVCDL